MSNTGRKVYQFLKQVNGTTGVPTGLRKANVVGDPDYQQPIADYALCPIVGWEATGASCQTVPTCPPGWTLNSEGNRCVMNLETLATPPTAGGGTPGIVGKVNNNQWNNGGALLFDLGGYKVDGTVEAGFTSTGLLAPHFWVNGTSPYNNTTRNTVDGRMNAAGIWLAGHALDGLPLNEFIGFSRKVTVTTAKVVYVGICGDNTVKITVNGIKLVEMTNQNGGPNFNFMNIYPVQLNAGANYIELYGLNGDAAAGFAAEIYDVTKEQLLAATTEADLNIIFSTKNIVGQPFDLGDTIGYSCPPTWSLDTSGPFPVCRKNDTISPTIKNTGVKSYSSRARLTNGALDGYTEANLNGTGLGPYFPPVTDLVNCPT